MQLTEIKNWISNLKNVDFKWPFDQDSMEYKTTLSAAKTSFIAGFIVNGMLGQPNALQRFTIYSAGKNFGNARNALRRKMDYSILMFAKNGLRGGLRLGFAGGFSMLVATQWICYRKHCSPIILPLAFGTTCSILMARGGTLGLAYGFIVGFIPGLVFTGGLCGFAWYNKLSLNDGYWLLKKFLEGELRFNKIHREQIKRLMEKEQIYLKFFAEKRFLDLNEKEKNNLILSDDEFLNNDKMIKNENIIIVTNQECLVDGIPISD